jgi:hypothetical protein
MAELKEEIAAWLQGLPAGTRVGVTEGGLLRAELPGCLLYDVGGLSEASHEGAYATVFADVLELYFPNKFGADLAVVVPLPDLGGRKDAEVNFRLPVPGHAYDVAVSYDADTDDHTAWLYDPGATRTAYHVVCRFDGRTRAKARNIVVKRKRRR